jgi:hypothetical protein
MPNSPPKILTPRRARPADAVAAGRAIGRKQNMTQTQTIPETFLGVGYTRDRAGLPLEAVRVPVPQPAADEVLIRVAASSLNPLEYKLADLNFMASTFPASSSPRAMMCAAWLSATLWPRWPI